VGCNDLWPSALDAIAILNNPKGGTLNTCTVYGSGYGATQRPGYSLTYTPPPATSVAGVAGAVSNALTGSAGGGIVSTAADPLVGGTTTTILGLPWYLVVGGGVAAFLAFRR
jgi:hypothetical protein